MGVLNQTDHFIAGSWFRFTEFRYSATSETYSADPMAMTMPSGERAKVFHLEGGTAPDAAVTSASATAATVTLGAVTPGTFGRILVVTQHGVTAGGVKQSS